MKNLYDDKIAQKCRDDLSLRVYTSNLLGKSDELVLHGGGNTSVKVFQGAKEVLYVKGSGWDLVDIKAEGFAPVWLKTLQDMAKKESLSDSEMVASQKAAMLDKSAPNPSVEAILHAIIPFKFVDHTHADAIVTISNSKNGQEYIKRLYPDFLIVPYVMPGFVLAHTIYEMTRDMDWFTCKGIILHNHGIFTFDDDAKKSYTKMIDAVNVAEDFLEQNATVRLKTDCRDKVFDIDTLQKIMVREKGYDVALKINRSALACAYASKPNLQDFASRGVLTPEHIIRTKRVPLVLENNDIENAIKEFEEQYETYFNKYAKNEIALNPAPCYVVIKDFGVVSFGKNDKEAAIIDDIVSHTMLAVLKADKLGGYESINEKESFKMEYWELEQAKVIKGR